MTAHKRSLPHRLLKVRQLPVGGPKEGDAGGNQGGGSGTGSATTPPPTPPTTTATPPPQTSTTAQAPPPPPPPAPTTTSSTTQPQQQPSATKTTPRTSSTAPADPTTTSSTSSSATQAPPVVSASSISSNRVPSTTIIVNNIAPTTATNAGVQSSFASVPNMTVDSAGSTVSASALPEQTGASSTGGIVGGVIGGLAGIALLGMIILFFVKRRRNKRAEEDFGTDFRRSAFMANSRPASMAPVSTRGHNVAPSVSSAGMAGKGAFDSYGATEKSAGYSTGAGAAAAAAAAAAAKAHLQERPKYVYGQTNSNARQQYTDGHEDEGSEHAHGVYSSEPLVQTTYNPETYGSYAAYEQNGGYQEPTREYQGQGGYAVTQDGYPQEYYQNPYGQEYAQQNYNEAQHGQYDHSQYTADPSQYAQYDQSAYAVTGNAPVVAGAHPSGTHQEDAYGGM